MIQAIAVSPDGARIAAADSDGNARIVETDAGKEVHSFRMAAGIGVKKSLTYSPERHRRGAIKPVARPRLCGRRPIAWSRTCLPSCVIQPMLLPVCGATLP